MATRGYSVWAGAGVGAGSPVGAELEVGAPAERLPHRAAYYRAFPARLDAHALAGPQATDARCAMQLATAHAPAQVAPVAPR